MLTVERDYIKEDDLMTYEIKLDDGQSLVINEDEMKSLVDYIVEEL